MYGYEDPETFIAESKDIVSHYADSDDRREVLRVLAEKRYMEPREFRLKRRDGSIFPAMVTAREIRNEHDELVGYQASHIDISALKSAEAELRASREQMRTLAYRAQKTCEDERTTTARKIHDLLSQTLTRLKIDLVWLQRRLENPGNAAPVIPRVAEMARMADEALSTVQRIATELRPAVLDSLGLCAALEWLARDFKDHCEIGCRAFVPEREPSIDRDTATAAFRIVQESLTNVYRHSSATAVEICLETEEDQIVLSIHDDGIGIDPKKFADPLSIGLAGMRERALLAGGSFDIRSRHSSGTIVEAHFPLQRSNGFPPGET
jgi:PAS domain S-box-containing protein